MTEQYKCQVCMKLFPTSKAIDGYGEGCRKGFLCPHCKSNLTEAGESDDILHLEYGITYSVIMSLLVWLVSSERIAYSFVQSSLLNGLIVLLVVSAIPTFLFIIVNKDALFKPRVIYTRKIHKQHHGTS
jgi:hypothetical protein